MNIPDSAVEAAAFVRPDRRELFEEHQRAGKAKDLHDHINKMLRDLYVDGAFSDRMATRSLLALMDSGKPADAV